VFMGLKDQIEHATDKVKDAVKHGVENTKDAVNEAQHRSQAEGEQAKRDIAGDAMTPTEYAGSVVNQTVNEAQASISHAKRDVRDTTS
jgi:F0F1-type ATP synthase membrane subunit b/b'